MSQPESQQERVARVLAEAQALLEKGRQALDESDAYFRSRGIDREAIARKVEETYSADERAELAAIVRADVERIRHEKVATEAPASAPSTGLRLRRRRGMV